MEAQEIALLKPLPGVPPEELEYPSTDGGQFAQSTWHANAMVLAQDALERHFSDRDDVFVAVDLLLYYEEGNIKARLAPDVLVSFSVADAGSGRSSYQIWKEGKSPEFVLEVASRSTHKTDSDEKLWKYAAIGVEEYWRLDPRGGLMVEALEGRRLRDGAYEPIQPWDRSGRTWYRSNALGLDLSTKPVRGARGLAFRDPLTMQEVLSKLEIDRALAAEKEERVRAQAEAARAKDLKARAENRAARAEARAARAEARVAELTKENDSSS